MVVPLLVMARPSKLTPEIQAKIVEAITAGNYLETSARYAGVGVATFYTWMSKGEGKHAKSPYKEFREAVEKARADAEVRNIALIQRTAQEGTWQAAAWFLERSHPQKWGKRSAVEVTGSDGGAVKLDISVDELERRVQQLLDKG